MNIYINDSEVNSIDDMLEVLNQIDKDTSISIRFNLEDGSNFKHKINCNWSASLVVSNINELQRYEDSDVKIILSYLYVVGGSIASIDDPCMDDILDRCMGQFDNPEDAAMYYLESMGYRISPNSFLYNYIDFEKLVDELFNVIDNYYFYVD
nr:MAG TPA: hypothetical protein [Caudoviricetes sp.]